MNKQPEITDATRENFIDSFCWFYQERPIEKITVKEIAAKAGYSRATFYNYFKDPYDLLDQIQEELILTVFEEIKNNILLTKDWNEFTNSFLRMAQRNEKYIHVLLCGSNAPKFVDKVKDHALPGIAEVLNLPDDNYKARYAAEFYISGIIPVIGTWLKGGQIMPADELVEMIRGILEDGVLKQII